MRVTSRPAKRATCATGAPKSAIVIAGLAKLVNEKRWTKMVSGPSERIISRSD